MTGHYYQIVNLGEYEGFLDHSPLFFLNEKVLCNLELGPCILMFIFGRKGTREPLSIVLLLLLSFQTRKWL